MAKGISLSVASDTRDFLRGIKSGVVDPLEDAADELKRLEKAGDRAGDQLEDSMRDAQKDTERLAGEYEQLNRKIRDAGSGGRKFAGDVKDSTSDAQRAVREFGDEAKQNMAETFSSFDGSAESFADGLQGTFGGVISSLGPVGMAAGAAGALGIGMILAGLEKSDEEAQAFRERVAGLASEFIETGGIGESSLGFIVDRLKELASTTEEGQQNLAGIYRDAQGSASGFRRIADAYAGNTDALDELVKKEREHLAALKETAKSTELTWTPEAQAAAIEKRDAQQRIVEGLEQSAEAAQEAQDAEEAYLASDGPLYEAKAEAIDTIQGELDEAIGSWGDYQDAETGALDPAGYIAAMQARMDATNNFNTNVQTLAQQFGLSFEETQHILDQGVDFAPMLQSIIDSGLGEQFAAQVQAAVGGGQEIIEGTPLGATVSVAADTGTAQQQLEETSASRETTIEAEADTGDAETSLMQFARAKRTTTITAEVDLTLARQRLSEFVNERRVAVVTVDTRDREGRPVP